MVLLLSESLSEKSILFIGLVFVDDQPLILYRSFEWTSFFPSLTTFFESDILFSEPDVFFRPWQPFRDWKFLVLLFFYL